MENGALRSHRVGNLPGTWRRFAFLITWGVANVVLGSLLVQGQYSFASQATLVCILILFLCTVSLMWWISNPITNEPTDKAIRKGWFSLVIVVTVSILFPLHTLVGGYLLVALPPIALGIIVVLKQPITKRAMVYVLSLALLAGIAGLGAGWIKNFTPAEWSILQVLIVPTNLLAGWGILQYSGLSANGVGQSRFLAKGIFSAARSFLQGILLGIPWAFGNVAMGGSNSQTWVNAWWQPLIAIQPGIAEEAWARIFLVSLLFLIIRRVSPTRMAFTVALVVVGYWFAYLHTSGGLGAIPSTLIVGTLYSLPLSYICFYRDLETAIGFHFWIDFTKFAFAFILNNG